MADPKAVDIKDNTNARDQFIALGVGVIVGRCGLHNGSPVSALTPPLLSCIGQEWIVTPARLVVVELASRLSSDAKEFVRFGVSPTLGLVGRPTMIDFGRKNKVRWFYGCVGPQASAGNRFALTMAQPADRSRPQMLAVIDTSGRGEDVRLCDWLDACWPWCNNRRWVAVLTECQTAPPPLSVWNFDGVESGRVAKVEGVAMPWRVGSALLVGDDNSLVVSLVGGGGVMVIDLEATLARNRLVWADPSHLSIMGSIGDPMVHQIESMICWNGVLYAVLSGTDGSSWLQCLTTGVSTKLSRGSAEPLGGPYVASQPRCSRNTG
ncbi:hypothetical protein Pelo_18971 [Pelomyxa schiedti]|nr:hypothetical protein Pelo_18971 [Pelomyxa schiedti]